MNQGINNQLENAYIAFVSMFHDIGKLSERGRIPECHPSDGDVQLCCPTNPDSKTFTHKHAAWSIKTIDDLEKTHCLPEIRTPNSILFTKEKSLINAIGKHHKPDTLTEWLIACADRIASGFERKQYDIYTEQYSADKDTIDNGKNFPSHYRSRLHSALASYVPDSKDVGKVRYAKLSPLSAQNTFFDVQQLSDKTTSQQQYESIYMEFKNSLKQIHNRDDFPLWLCHADSALLAHTYCIPSASPWVKQPDIKPEVSLYDHSKTVAGFAVALHQYYGSMGDDALSHLQHPNNSKDSPFLIIQGDFVGIQDFIFDTDAESDANTAKMLRGKSFYVSLLTELASLKICEALDLPCTSKVISVAGKFIIVAGNTEQNRKKLDCISEEISQWFLKNFYGVGNIVVAYTEAHSTDFLIKKSAQNTDDNHFVKLMDRLYEDLEKKKYQCHTLHKHKQEIVFDKRYVDFKEHGKCALNSNYPAEIEQDGLKLHKVSADYITIGENLVQNKHIVIMDKKPKNHLEQQIFGFYVAFIDTDKKSLKNTADEGIIRIWDYTLPDNMADTVFKGAAKIHISGHVPKHIPQDGLSENPIYKDIEDKIKSFPKDATLPFNVLSRRDLSFEQNTLYGVSALAVVKGDIDNLGTLFRASNSNFASYASLSRQVDMFFSIYLPVWLKEHPKYKYCYTVFAGGDDFMLVGSWHTMHNLVADLRQQFQCYTQNDNVTFSAGVVLCDEKTPIKTMSEIGEHALEQAKAVDGKDAVTMFSAPPVKWEYLPELKEYADKIENMRDKNKQKLSTGYVYKTMEFTDMAQDENKVQNAMWRSRHTYHTARYANDKGVDIKEMKQFLKLIDTYKLQAKIPLSLYLYKNRKYKKIGD